MPITLRTELLSPALIDRWVLLVDVSEQRTPQARVAYLYVKDGRVVSRAVARVSDALELITWLEPPITTDDDDDDDDEEEQARWRAMRVVRTLGPLPAHVRLALELPLRPAWAPAPSPEFERHLACTRALVAAEHTAFETAYRAVMAQFPMEPVPPFELASRAAKALNVERAARAHPIPEVEQRAEVERLFRLAVRNGAGEQRYADALERFLAEGDAVPWRPPPEGTTRTHVWLAAPGIGRHIGHRTPEVRVLVHDGGPSFSRYVPEAIRANVVDYEGDAYIAVATDNPVQPLHLKAGDRFAFRVSPPPRGLLLVTAAYRADLARWHITPCTRCGQADLLDPPSRLSKAKGATAFTEWCPLCGEGTLTVKQVDPPARA